MSFQIDTDQLAELASRPIHWKGVELVQLTMNRKQWLAFDDAVEITKGSEASVVRIGQSWCRGKGVEMSTHFGPWVDAFAEHWMAFNAEMARVKMEHEQRITETPDACNEHRRLMHLVLLAECENIRERYIHRGIRLADLKVSA